MTWHFVARRRVNRGSLDWGTVDAALYNEAFAGRAKVIPRCRYCLVDTHASHNCLHAPTERQASQAVDGRPGRAPPRPLGQTQAGRPGSMEICRLFNSPGGSRCRFPQCRYAHVCSKCRRPHSAAECGDRCPLTSTPLGAGSRAGSPPPPPPHSLEWMLVGSPADRTVQLLGTIAWIIMHALSS